MSVTSVALGLTLLALPLVQVAAESCDLDKQKDQRRKSLEFVSIVALSQLISNIGKNIARDDRLNSLQAVIHSFKEATFVTSTPSCDEIRPTHHPQYTGLSWLVEIPTDANADILVVRDRLSFIASENSERFQFVGNTFSDLEKSQEITVSSTIDFVLNNLDLLLFDSTNRRPRLIVSAPYWKVSEFGEKVIGFLKTNHHEKQIQNYVDFSAKHILCITQSGQIELESPNLSLPDWKSEIEKKAASCRSAVQVGPSYFNEKHLSAGISGSSKNQARRNILIRLARTDKSMRTFLWTIPYPISPFDAMVVIEAISEDLAKEGELLHWAVGLQDDKFMTGPLISDRGHFIPLTETDIQTGGFLMFFDSVQ